MEGRGRDKQLFWELRTEPCATGPPLQAQHGRTGEGRGATGEGGYKGGMGRGTGGEGEEMRPLQMRDGATTREVSSTTQLLNTVTSILLSRH